MKEHFLWEENALGVGRGGEREKGGGAVFQFHQLSLSVATVSITLHLKSNFLVNAASIKAQGTSGKMVK